MTGTYIHKIDAKGRLFLPISMRNELGESICVSRSFTKECAVVYSSRQWDEIREQIRQKPMDEAGEMQTYLGSLSSEQDFDAQGRITLKQDLRDEYNLNESVVVVGSMEWAEIWNADEWKEYNRTQTEEQRAKREKMKKDLGKIVVNVKLESAKNKQTDDMQNES
jgi:MraZ protein